MYQNTKDISVELYIKLTELNRRDLGKRCYQTKKFGWVESLFPKFSFTKDDLQMFLSRSLAKALHKATELRFWKLLIKLLSRRKLGRITRMPLNKSTCKIQLRTKVFSDFLQIHSGFHGIPIWPQDLNPALKTKHKQLHKYPWLHIAKRFWQSRQLQYTYLAKPIKYAWLKNG